MNPDNELITSLIDNAIKEDVGDGDHTTLASIPKGTTGKAHLIIKDQGILAGVDVARMIFNRIDSSIIFTQILYDGTRIKNNDVAFVVDGSVHGILKAERLVLNFMQRLSGIATQTSLYAEKLKGLITKILDTRKTTPGLRVLEKYAVKIGGGENHRIGLYDMILLKDNHIDYAGGIEKAIEATHSYLEYTNKNLKIEIEARNLEDVKRIVKYGGVHRILLDNFSIDDTKKAITLINKKYETESSGTITLENVRDYAECGVDFISIGALTHQIKSLDMSLKAI